MAKRIAQVDIKINGVDTIGRMEEELNVLKSTIKGIATSSKEFDVMADKIAGLEDKLKNANSKLEGVTSTEKAEGFLKMGEGIAGAVIGAQGLATALGGTSEELEKVIQRVGGLILALDGLRRVTEAFSAENIKRLRGVGRSFRGLAKTVKSASLAMRASLLATGIGALVVAVGLIIANWERLTAIVSNSGRQRQLKREVKELERVVETQSEVLAGTEAEAAARKELVDYNEQYYEAAAAAFDAQVKNQAAIETELKLNAKKLEQLKLDLQGRKEYNSVTGRAKKKFAELTSEVEKLTARQLQLNAEWELSGQQLDEFGIKMKNISTITSVEDQLKAVQNLVKEMGGLEFTQRRSYELAIKNLDLQVQAIELARDANGELRKSQREALNAYAAERKALEGKEALRIRDLKLQLEEINRGRDYELLQRDVGIQTEKNAIILENMLVSYDEQLTRNEAIVAAKERELELQAYIYEEAAKAFPQDQIGLEILERRLGFRRSEIDSMIELQGIEGDVSSLSFETKLQLKAQVDAMNSLYVAKQGVLETERESVKANIDALYTQQDLLDIVAYNAIERIKEVEAEREIYQANLDKAKTLEEQLKWKTKLSTIDAELLGLEDAVLDADTEIANLQNEIAGQKSVITAIDEDALALTEQKAIEEAKITYEVEQQLRLSARLNTFLSEYNEEIAAGQQLIGASFELWATFADRRAEMARREHEKALERVEELDDKLSDQQDLRADYEEELKDANGQRYDELLALIDGTIEKEGELQTARDEQNKKAMLAQYEMEVAQWKAEKRRKAAAIIDATIQGVIAVISALPNVILAAIVGVLAAVGVATIIAQPISPKPEPPKFAVGGYTGEGESHEVAGVVHKGEYVVPKSIVESSTGAEMIGTLEAMRRGYKGYADGGEVHAPTTTGRDQAFDMDMMIEGIANSLRRNPPVVSVLEITDTQNRVRVIESSAAI